MQQQLFSRHEIAVHGEDLCIINHRNYKEENQSLIKRFRLLAKEGGIVCAEYPAIDRMFIGEIPAVSDIVCAKDIHFLKRLKMQKTKELSSAMRVRLLAGAPRSGTLSQWHIIGDRLDHLLSGKRKTSWAWLLPYEQEAVCQEYLRAHFHLQHLLLPFGRNLGDIDIYGITEKNEMLFAHVMPREKDLSEILAALARYDGKRVIFLERTASSEEFQRTHRGIIEFVWTETLWEWLSATRNRRYKERLFTII